MPEIISEIFRNQVVATGLEPAYSTTSKWRAPIFSLRDYKLQTWKGIEPFVRNQTYLESIVNETRTRTLTTSKAGIEPAYTPSYLQSRQ